MASVELRGLRKSFGAVEIIQGMDLSIADGEFVALVGPSGCGKSTTLRIIAGLEEATGGEILIDGAVVNDLNPRERNIAMVFQSYALYPHMTVAQNIGFNLRLSRLPRDEIARRINEAARLLDITDLLGRRPAQLSGGQRQRVAMGRAIVRDPAAFLFDEPLSNLDAKLRVQMRSEIKTLHQKVGTTSIYVTHDQIEAMTLADRIVVLNKGVIEQAGTPLDLYLKPRNIFVAGFIGSPSMNFLDGVVKKTPEGLAVLLETNELLTVGPNQPVEDGQPVIVGVRPEHLHPGAGVSTMNGQASLVEPTGAQTHVSFQLGQKTLTAVVDGAHRVAYGDSFVVSVDAANIHLFDRATTLRI